MTGRKISVQSVRKQRQKLGILKASGRGFCKARPITQARPTKPFPSASLSTPTVTVVPDPYVPVTIS
jgi:hypothetical protein